MQVRLLVLACALIAPLATALEPLPDAPRVLEVYYNGVSLARYDGGEVTCLNGAFATVTLLSTGAALLALESPTCVNFAGAFTAAGSFEEGWALEYAVPTPNAYYRATIGSDPELPTFRFESFSSDSTTGASTHVIAHGYLRAVVGEPGLPES